jgi:hypothetical protein
MENHIDDGELHALSDDYGYALKLFLEDPSIHENSSRMTELRDDFAKKYADYLYQFDKEKVIRILMEYLVLSYNEDIQFIFRPAYMVSSLAQNASFAMKFKRSQNDNLGEKSDKDRATIQRCSCKRVRSA